jgi:hypothetical protein
MEHSDSPDMALVKRYLVPVYMRLSLPGFFRAGRPAPMPSHLMTNTTVPAEFESLDEARSLLFYLMDESLRITAEGKPAVYDPNMTAEHWDTLKAVQQRLHSQLSQWNTNFAMLMATLPSGSSRSVTDMQRLLQILYESSTIWVATALQPLEIAYDSHLPAFTAIVSNATALLQSATYQSTPRPFTFETELIAPLYWTAIKCRHPRLRRTALRLLMKDEMRNRRENIWSSETTITVASRVIELEEEGRVDKPEGFVNWDRFFAETGDDFDLTSDSYDEHEGFQQPSPSMNHQVETYEGELTIPVDRPPTLPVTELDVAEWLPEDEAGIWGDRKLPYRIKWWDPKPFTPAPLEPAPSMVVEGFGVEPPYGVPEFQRIKNVMIGPIQNGGVWVTIFRNAKDGSTTWNVTREFLKQL